MAQKRINKRMGLIIKKARTEQKMTYDELSDKSGVSTRYIKEIENHGNVPSFEILKRLICSLHIPTDQFFTKTASLIIWITNVFLPTYQSAHLNKSYQYLLL